MRALLCCVYSFFGFVLAAQDGMLDLSFGDTGVVNYNYPALSGSNINSISVSRTGQIILSSWIRNTSNSARLVLMALKPNGEIDTGFGNAGYKSIPCNNCYDQLNGLLHIANGRFMIANTVVVNSSVSELRIWRLDSTGTIESSFIIDILGIDDLVELLENSSGDLIAVVSNRERIGMKRFSFSGVEDQSFGINGISATPADIVNFEYGAALNHIDEILVGGAHISGSSMKGLIYKFLANGMRDSAFGENGRVLFSEYIMNDVNRLGVLPNGKIIVFGWGPVGTSIWGVKLVGLLHDGAVDSAFGNNGVVELARATHWKGQEELLIQPDGKILVFGGGHYNGMFVDRFLSNGEIDSAFGFFGRSEYFLQDRPFKDAVLQKDGQILVAGPFHTPYGTRDTLDILVARFNSIINISVEENPILSTEVRFFPNPFSDHATLQFSLLEDARLSISLINLLGIKVADLAKEKSFGIGENEISISDFGSLPSGQYFVVISSNANRVSIPIIKTE